MSLPLVLLAVILFGNLVVSILVVRSRFYSPFQKWAQCAIVWLIPVLGAVGVWAFLLAQYRWEKYDTRAYPEPSQKMVLAELDSSANGHSVEGGVQGGSD
jgi:hypothetical protein